MKKQISFYWIPLLFLLLTPVSFAKGKHSAHDHASMGHETSSSPSEHSLYNLESQWKNQNGKSISLSAFKGTPVVLTMAYTSCEYACPLLTSDMIKIRDRLSAEERKKVHFVIVTIDPTRDTPKKLKTYLKKRKIHQKNWSALQGENDDTLELAAALGVKYRKTSSGDYSHSNLIHVIDRGGVVKHQQSGLNQDPTTTVQILKKL